MSEHFNAKGKQFNCVRPRTKWWLSDENRKYYVSPKNGHLKSAKDGERFQYLMTMVLRKKKKRAREAACKPFKVLKMKS